MRAASRTEADGSCCSRVGAPQAESARYHAPAQPRRRRSGCARKAESPRQSTAPRRRLHDGRPIAVGRRTRRSVSELGPLSSTIAAWRTSLPTRPSRGVDEPSTPRRGRATRARPQARVRASVSSADLRGTREDMSPGAYSTPLPGGRGPLRIVMEGTGALLTAVLEVLSRHPLSAGTAAGAAEGGDGATYVRSSADPWSRSERCAALRSPSLRSPSSCRC